MSKTVQPGGYTIYKKTKIENINNNKNQSFGPWANQKKRAIFNWADCVCLGLHQTPKTKNQKENQKKMAAVTLVLNELQSNVTSANLTVPAGSNSPGDFYSVGLVRPCGSRYPPATNAVRRLYLPCGQTLPSAVTSNPPSTVLNSPKSTVALSFSVRHVRGTYPPCSQAPGNQGLKWPVTWPSNFTQIENFNLELQAQRANSLPAFFKSFGLFP